MICCCALQAPRQAHFGLQHYCERPLTYGRSIMSASRRDRWWSHLWRWHSHCAGTHRPAAGVLQSSALQKSTKPSPGVAANYCLVSMLSGTAITSDRTLLLVRGSIVLSGPNATSLPLRIMKPYPVPGASVASGCSLPVASGNISLLPRQ